MKNSLAQALPLSQAPSIQQPKTQELRLQNLAAQEMAELRIAAAKLGYESPLAFLRCQIRTAIRVVKIDHPELFQSQNPLTIHILSVLHNTVSTTIPEIRALCKFPVKDADIRLALQSLIEQGLVVRKTDYQTRRYQGRPSARYLLAEEKDIKAVQMALQSKP